MYPPPTTYNAIKLPIIPYPQKTIREIKEILSGQQRRIDKTLQTQLRQAGLIALTKEGRIVITEEGKKIYNHVLKHIT